MQPPTRGEGERTIIPHARIYPGGGIAEAFTNIIAPGERVRLCIRGKQVFFDAGRLAKLAPGAFLCLDSKKIGVFPTGSVPEPRPYEVKDFMYQDERQALGLRQQLGFKDDLTNADEAGRVNRRASLRAL